VAVHEVFCQPLRARGYQWGPQTDEARKTHSALKPYAELPEEEQELNRGNVRDIPRKLARLGYVMRPARRRADLRFP
jgi:RyR domain